MPAIICNKDVLMDAAPILRDRIWYEGDGMLMVDTYPHSFDDPFDFEAWDAGLVFIKMDYGFKHAYRSARLLLRRLGLTGDAK